MNRRSGQSGLTLLEICMVVAIMITVAAVAVPNILRAVYNVRLRSAAGELSGLMQEARILAAKNNATYDIKYTTVDGIQVAYVDRNLNGVYDAASSTYVGDPVVFFNHGVTPASAAPAGSGGQPTAYTLVGDSSSGTPYDNTYTLAFSPRGLPCNDASGTCTTPASTYFVYYLVDSRPGGNGWAAVVVSRAGRSKVIVWDGSQWN